MNDAKHTCRWCGMIHGPMCPAIKSIEFYEDGVTVKHVEYNIYRGPLKATGAGE